MCDEDREKKKLLYYFFIGFAVHIQVERERAIIKFLRRSRLFFLYTLLKRIERFYFSVCGCAVPSPTSLLICLMSAPTRRPLSGAKDDQVPSQRIAL